MGCGRRFATRLIVLVATIWVFAQIADVADGMQPAGNEESWEDLRQILEMPSPTERFNEFYSQLFDPEAPQLTPEEVHKKLKEARLLLLDSSVSLEDRLRHGPTFRRLNEIALDNGCSINMLESRYALEVQYNQHHNLGPFVKHHNRQQYRKCALELEKRFLHVARQSGHSDTMKTVQLIRERQFTDGDQFALENSMSLRDISRGVIEYIEQMRGPIEKPRDLSMRVQIQRVGGIIGLLFYDECADVSRRFGQDFYVYQMLVQYDHDLGAIFTPTVKKFLDRIQLCQSIVFHYMHIYPLAKFNLDELTSQILSTNEQADLMNPEVIRELLEISLFVGQAELVLGQSNPTLMRRFIAYLTVSQISPEKCTIDYLQHVINIRDQSRQSYPNLHNYLMQYGRAQMVRCLSSLGFSLTVLTSTMEHCDHDMLNELANVFNEIVQQIGDSTVKLYDNISYKVLRLSLEKWMYIRGGVNMFDPDEKIEKLDQFQPQLQKLYDSCREFVQVLGPQQKLFRLLQQLDVGNQIRRRSAIISWMAKYKICQNVLDLPPEIKIISETV